MFRIEYTPRSFKSLQALPKKIQMKILFAIEELKVEPYLGKKLQGPLAGLYSLRVWPYRIIYMVKKREVFIVILEIGHRQGVYKKHF